MALYLLMEEYYWMVSTTTGGGGAYTAGPALAGPIDMGCPSNPGNQGYLDSQTWVL